MLQEPGTSPYDLQFSFLGFPVRVAWGFWIMAAVLGWGWSGSVDQISQVVGMDSPGPAMLLVVWAAGVFISILVHELGHTLAMKYYGIRSRIVLYHFGGLAIPDSFGSWDGARQRRVGAREQIIISAAGPAIQLALGVFVWILGLQLNVRMEETELVNRLFGLDLGTIAFPGSAVVYAFFSAILYPSFVWAILNLAPILPLDGGQILRSALMLFNVNQPTRLAHMVSVFAAGGLGLWFMSSGQTGGIMFLLFAASNWQAMQQSSGPF